MSLLDVRGLTTRFFTGRGTVGAVEDVSIDVAAGEAVGIVGESGSGKSVAALSILRLVPMPGRIVAGSITFRGEDVLAMDEARLRALRRHEIAMVFQASSLFDWMTVYESAQSRAVGKLSWVRVPNSHDTQGYCRLMAQPDAPGRRMLLVEDDPGDVLITREALGLLSTSSSRGIGL